MKRKGMVRCSLWSWTLVSAALALATQPVTAQQCPGWHDYKDPNSSVSGGGTGAAAAEADMKKRARALCKVSCDDDVEVEKVGGGAAAACEARAFDGHQPG